MVIALLCPVLSFVPEERASSMIEHGLAQKDEQWADRKAGFIFSGSASVCLHACVCVCVGGTEAIFRLKRHWFTFWPERLGRKAGWRMMVGVNRNWGVYAFSAEPCCYLAQNTTESQRCVFASISLGVSSHSPAIYMTEIDCVGQLEQWSVAGSAVYDGHCMAFPGKCMYQ